MVPLSVRRTSAIQKNELTGILWRSTKGKAESLPWWEIKPSISIMQSQLALQKKTWGSRSTRLLLWTKHTPLWQERSVTSCTPLGREPPASLGKWFFLLHITSEAHLECWVHFWAPQHKRDMKLLLFSEGQQAELCNWSIWEKAERTETVQPGEKKDRRDLISAQQTREDRTRLFSAVPSNKMRDNWNKLK